MAPKGGTKRGSAAVGSTALPVKQVCISTSSSVEAPAREADVIDLDAIESLPSLELPQGSNMGDLACFIDSRKTCCANEDPQHPHTHVLKGVPRIPSPGPGTMLVSNCDPQLLFEIGFSGAVRVQRLCLRAPSDGRAPAEVRLFVNAPHLDFDGAEERTATQMLDLSEHWQADGTSEVVCDVTLNFARFQHVTTLTMFIVGNVGQADTTALCSLIVIGARVHRVIVVPGVL